MFVPFLHGDDTKLGVMDKRFWNSQICIQFLSNGALFTPKLAAPGSLPVSLLIVEAGTGEILALEAVG